MLRSGTQNATEAMCCRLVASACVGLLASCLCHAESSAGIARMLHLPAAGRSMCHLVLAHYRCIEVM